MGDRGAEEEGLGVNENGDEAEKDLHDEHLQTYEKFLQERGQAKTTRISDLSLLNLRVQSALQLQSKVR